jgi:hypothetical protein
MLDETQEGPRAAADLITPGSIIVRPTRQDAEQHAGHFYLLLKALRANRELPLKKLGYITGDTTNNREINIWKRIKNETLTPDERDLILRHVFDEARLLSGKFANQLATIEDAFYFAFLNYAAVKETSQDKVRARSIGTYRFWRPSVDFDDEYVFGKIKYEANSKTGALDATMLQVRQPSPGHGRTEEHFSGHLFRVSHLYLMILCDQITNDIRMTFLTHRTESQVGTDLNPRSPFQGRMAHNVTMEGHVFGVSGQKRFFAPLYLTLVDDVDELATLDSQLNIVKEHEVPERVLKKLKGMGKLLVL